MIKMCKIIVYVLSSVDVKFGLSLWRKSLHWRWVRTKCWGRYLDLTEIKLTKEQENYLKI